MLTSKILQSSDQIKMVESHLNHILLIFLHWMLSQSIYIPFISLIEVNFKTIFEIKLKGLEISLSFGQDIIEVINSNFRVQIDSCQLNNARNWIRSSGDNPINSTLTITNTIIKEGGFNLRFCNFQAKNLTYTSKETVPYNFKLYDSIVVFDNIKLFGMNLLHNDIFVLENSHLEIRNSDVSQMYFWNFITVAGDDFHWSKRTSDIRIEETTFHRMN